MPKNAQNKAAANAYLDAMLEAPSQIDFAKNMGYNPSAENVKVAEEILNQTNWPFGAALAFVLRIRW